MIVFSVTLAIILPCAGMSIVLILYICLLWFATNYQVGFRSPVMNSVAEKGLVASELEKLPRVTGKELVMGTECAVCLDEIGGEEPVRVVPGCIHGFHLECADTWLSQHLICPVCRGKASASGRKSFF